MSLPIRAWVYDDDGTAVGIVVEEPNGAWRYRQFALEDRLVPPVPTGRLVEVLRPYVGEPDGTYPPGAQA